MPANLQKQMLGGDGVMRLIDNGTPVASGTGYLFDYVIVNETAIVNEIIDEYGNSLVGPWGILGKTLSPGILLIGRNGGRIRGISVTSGSVIGYQSRDYGNL